MNEIKTFIDIDPSIPLIKILVKDNYSKHYVALNLNLPTSSIKYVEFCLRSAITKYYAEG